MGDAKETILIIDDGRDNREFLIEHVLTPNGFHHLQAADGLEGLRMALSERPDLILLDYQMPKMNGRQVLEKLRERGSDVPVILMTFHGSEEIAVEVYRLGVRDYIKKPYYPEEMLAAIERGLAESRLKREKEQLTERVLLANRELQRRLRELNTLSTVGKHVTTLANMEELLPRVVDALVQLTNAEEATLCLIEGKMLVRRAIKTPMLAQTRAVAERVKDPLAVQAIRTRQPLLLNAQQLEGVLEPPLPNSVVVVPLLFDERVLGTLSIANYTPNSGAFNANDVALVRALGDYAAIAIENSRHYVGLSQSKDRLRNIFEQFVAPQIVEQVLANPDDVKLGGERQELTVLFADIRGFTSWSEATDPEVVVETLNHYLSLAANVVLGWEGTLDKFFGDGLMAIFNAPIRQADHVYRAVDAALALRRAAQEVSEQYGHQLSYGIGVHVGEAVVGYIGAERALNYTAIGDTVNLAKRLQEGALPNQILISEIVLQKLGGRAKAKSLGEMKVKGRKTLVSVYDLHDLT